MAVTPIRRQMSVVPRAPAPAPMSAPMPAPMSMPSQQGWVWNGTQWCWGPDFDDPCCQPPFQPSAPGWSWCWCPSQGSPPAPCPPTPLPPTPLTGPILGVTDGSAAAPGQVGEFVQATVAGTFTAAVQTQVFSTLVLQPGDWDAVAWCIMSPITGQTSAIDGCWFALSPQPTGASGNMFVANMANPTAMIPSDESAWLTTVAPRTQVNVSVPTLLAFTLTTNPSANGAAGNFNFYVNARRMR